MLTPDETFFFLIDVQKKLFPHIERGAEALSKMILALKGAQLMNCPIFCTEQSPEKLGETLPSLVATLGKEQPRHRKETFSAVGEESIAQTVQRLERPFAVLMGIETHVCVLQTAYDLIEIGIEPIILSDATSSRSLYDFSSAIGELKDEGIRVTSVETLLFELTGTAKAPWFKDLQKLIKETPSSCCSI